MSDETSATGFFRSRWVERPEHVRELPSGTLPPGFRAVGVEAGIKPEGLDLAVLVSDAPATVSAARFTTSAHVGAPVIVSRASARDRLRAIVANSGGANTGDGERGIDTARATQHKAAELLGIEPEQVGVASTGVIGVELPREPLLEGIAYAIPRLQADSDSFSRAILTSDRGPKRGSLEVTLPAGTVRISAQAKGAGMISPRYATMFCFVQTDAAMDAATLDLLTSVCVKRSFDRISVDGQLSTSDTVFTMAGGGSGVQIQPETPDELRFGEAMDALMRQLAMEILHDGEGAKRVGRIVVRGDAERIGPVARAVANSALVKTALHGGDPNFGRILQAAGQVLPPSEPFLPDLEIEGRQVVSAGQSLITDLDELAELGRLVDREEVEYVLTLPGSGGETEVYFSDLSPEYVRFNAEYTS